MITVFTIYNRNFVNLHIAHASHQGLQTVNVVPDVIINESFGENNEKMLLFGFISLVLR